MPPSRPTAGRTGLQAAGADRAVLAGLAALLALGVLAPLLAPGFVLTYDMVFVPDPPLGLEQLGVSRTLPRPAPTAFLVGLASRLLTGQVVQKLLLVLALAGAAYGAARLVPSERTAARLAGGVLYAWNPFTYERLLIGHWALLLGYAALPWVVTTALSVRRGERGAWGRMLVALAVAAAAGPYSGTIAAAVALAVAAWPSGRRERPDRSTPAGRPRRSPLLLLAVVLAANLPWVVPAVLHPGVPERSDLAVRLFGARSDSPLGTLGSVLSFGGLWNTDLAPPGRDTLTWVPAFLLIGALALRGWRLWEGRWPEPARRGLLAAAVVGLVLAVAPAYPATADGYASLARNVPGGGILRESQKFVIPYALLLAVAFGLGVERLLVAARRAGGRAPLAATLLAPILPLALAPALAWGASGGLWTASYPASWTRAEDAMTADPVSGGVLVLPWHAFLPFGWNGGRTVQQPARPFFSRPVVASSALEVGPHELPQEDPWARLADPAVRSGEELAARLPVLGIRYVLLFREADWRRHLEQLDGLEVVLDEPDLSLYRAPPPSRLPTFPAPPAGHVIAADVMTLLLAGIVGAGLLRARWRRV